MQRLVNTSAPRVKGAHDAEFVCVGERAYIVTEANDMKAGESAGWPFIYATLSIVNLKTLALEQVIDFARGEQVFANETLPAGCNADRHRPQASTGTYFPASVLVHIGVKKTGLLPRCSVPPTSL